MMKNNITSFLLIFIAVTGVGTVCLGEQIQLNWLSHWKGEDKREQLVDEVKKEYEFLHQDIKINMLYNVDLTGPGKNYKWKTAHEIVDMIKTNTIRWDVIYLGGAVYNHVAELLGDHQWGKKYLVDFSEIPGFLKTQKEFIVKDPYYKDQTGGIFVGPMIEGFICCLWYNPEVARKVGIQVNERGMTIQDFINYARKLAEYNRTNNTSIPFIKLSTWNRLEILFEYLYKSQFGNPQEPIVESFTDKKKQVFFDTLLLFEQLSQFQPVLNENWSTLEWDQWKRDFLDGDGLFIVAGTYMYSLFKGIDSEKYQKAVPLELPFVKQPNGLVGDYINTFAVMKQSRKRQAAVDLLMLWSEPKVAEKWVTYTRNPTGIRGNLKDPVNDALTNDVYNKFLKDLDNKYAHLPMRYFRDPSYAFGVEFDFTANELRSALASILQGDNTAEQVFNEIIARLEKRKSDD